MPPDLVPDDLETAEGRKGFLLLAVVIAVLFIIGVVAFLAVARDFGPENVLGFIERAFINGETK